MPPPPGRQALDAKEFAWGAQLIQYVYLLNPEDKEVRQLKADLLRQMAYRSTGSIARAFFMSEALGLETTDRSIGEIAYVLGYTDSSNSPWAFRRQVGISSQAWRDNRGKGSPQNG